MSSPHSQEGIVFGDGHHLPDATVLQQVSQEWESWHLGEQSYNLARVPGRPDSIVRHVGMFETEGREQQVKKGIKHLQYLKDCGLTILPHRFVEGPMLYSDRRQSLYAFTNFIQGRVLTATEPRPELIAAHARYLELIVERSEPEFMSDIASAKQHTETNEGEVVLHDTGLNYLRPTQTPPECEGLGENFNIRYSITKLEQWRVVGKVERPEELDRLISSLGLLSITA